MKLERARSRGEGETLDHNAVLMPVKGSMKEGLDRRASDYGKL